MTDPGMDAREPELGTGGRVTVRHKVELVLLSLVFANLAVWGARVLLHGGAVSLLPRVAS